MPQSARLSAGGGFNGYLGSAQMNRDFLCWGFPMMEIFNPEISLLDSADLGNLLLSVEESKWANDKKNRHSPHELTH